MWLKLYVALMIDTKPSEEIFFVWNVRLLASPNSIDRLFNGLEGGRMKKISIVSLFLIIFGVYGQDDTEPKDTLMIQAIQASNREAVLRYGKVQTYLADKNNFEYLRQASKRITNVKERLEFMNKKTEVANYTEKQRTTALYEYETTIEILKILLDTKPSQATIERGVFWSLGSDPREVKLFIDALEPDTLAKAVSTSDWTPLMAAAKMGSIYDMNLLIKAGINVNARAKADPKDHDSYYTPLYYIFFPKSTIDLVRYYDLNGPMTEGEYIAIYQPHKNLVKKYRAKQLEMVMILDKAKFKPRDSDFNPLIEATQWCNFSAIKQLVRMGVKIPEDILHTAIQCIDSNSATENQNDFPAEAYGDRFSIAEYFLNKGILINTRVSGSYQTLVQSVESYWGHGRSSAKDFIYSHGYRDK